MFLALLHPILLGAALQVQGGASCPEPAQVSADLQKILDISSEYAPNLHADLNRDGAWLELTLTDADGTSLGERRFDANEDCAVLSHTVAVVLATWLSDEHPEYLVALPENDASTKAAPAPIPAPTVQAAPVPPSLAPPAPPVPTRSRSTPSRGTGPALGRYRLVPSVALAASASGGGFAPGAWLGVALDSNRQGLGVDLGVAWLGDREQSLAQHQVRWSRWPMLVGPFLRMTTNAGRFDLGAGASFGFLRLSGRDFTPNTASTHATFGSYAALRFLPSAGTWQPFFTAAPMLWFGRATVFASGENGALAEATLPSIELLLAAGVRFLP